MLFQLSFSQSLILSATILLLIFQSSYAIDPVIQELYCQDLDSSISCQGSYDPVCASYQRFCSQPPCPQYLEFPNNCAACQDPTVISYQLGSCSRVCPPSGIFANCTNELIHPVCGDFTEDCNSTDCQASFENSCVACLNTSVISYKPGKCPYDEGISCSTYIPSISCAEGSYISVCGTLDQDCGGIPCRQTFENPCSACIDNGAISFTPGPCEEDDSNEDSNIEGDQNTDVLIYCEEERPTNCSLDFELVCAYFLIGCPDGVCSRTEVNGCTACQYPNVESYSFGRCEREKIPCDPSNRPTLCDNTPDPVCSFFINCANGACNQTEANSCNACMDSNVQYYVSGAC